MKQPKNRFPNWKAIQTVEKALIQIKESVLFLKLMTQIGFLEKKRGLSLSP